MFLLIELSDFYFMSSPDLVCSYWNFSIVDFGDVTQTQAWLQAPENPEYLTGKWIFNTVAVVGMRVAVHGFWRHREVGKSYPNWLWEGLGFSAKKPSTPKIFGMLAFLWSSGLRQQRGLLGMGVAGGSLVGRKLAHLPPLITLTTAVTSVYEKLLQLDISLLRFHYESLEWGW